MNFAWAFAIFSWMCSLSASISIILLFSINSASVSNSAIFTFSCMALALLDTFDFKESASDDLELEALLDLDDLVDSFDDLPFELLPDDFDFLSHSSSASFSQFQASYLKMNTLWSTSSKCSSSLDCSSSFKILQCFLHGSQLSVQRCRNTEPTLP